MILRRVETGIPCSNFVLPNLNVLNPLNLCDFFMVIEVRSRQAIVRIVKWMQFAQFLQLLLVINLDDLLVGLFDFRVGEPAIIPLVLVFEPNIVIQTLRGLRCFCSSFWMVSEERRRKLLWSFKENKVRSDMRVVITIAFIHPLVVGCRAMM